MILDHLEHSVNVKDRPTMLLAPYVEAQDKLARLHIGNGKPFRAFFIGGGGYTLPRAWLSRGAHHEMHVAEIDPSATRVAHEQLWLTESPRLKIIHEDARHALRRHTGEPFNVIVGDAFHDISVPQHLVTKEFFSLIFERLTPDGAYLMNVVDHTLRPRLVLSIVETLKIRFPVVEVWKASDAEERATFVILAARKRTPSHRVVSETSPELAYERVPAGELAELARRLAPFKLTDDYAPVDRLIAVH